MGHQHNYRIGTLSKHKWINRGRINKLSEGCFRIQQRNWLSWQLKEPAAAAAAGMMGTESSQRVWKNVQNGFLLRSTKAKKNLRKHYWFLKQLLELQQLWAMEKSTKLRHWKDVGISINPESGYMRVGMLGVVVLYISPSQIHADLTPTTKPHTHALGTQQPSTPPPNAPTLTYLD